MNIEPLLIYMKQHQVDLTTDEKKILLDHVYSRKFLKNQYIVQQGDVCKTENFIVSGCLKVFYINNEGQEHIVSFGIENWWTSDLGSFITQTPASYNIKCLENTEVIQFSYEKLQKLYILIPKLERFFRIILEKAYASSQQRIINNFNLSARNRYINFKTQYPQIEQRVPQYMIASYLGITKEFLSKIRKQLISES